MPVRDDPATLQAILASLDPRSRRPLHPTGEQLADLMAFLYSQTSPTLDALGESVPDSVPSGLPVDRGVN